MIFEYEELKEYVRGDFERFIRRGFDEKYIFPAVLNEYQYAKDFCLVENICIDVFLALIYIENNLDCKEIIESLDTLMSAEETDKIKDEMGTEYSKLCTDMHYIKNYKV